MPGRVPATRGTSPCRHGREQPRTTTGAVANSGIGTPLPRAQEASRTAEATRRRRKLFPAALPGSQRRSTFPGTRLAWGCGSTLPPPPRPEQDERGGMVWSVGGKDLADNAAPSGNARRADVQAACPSHFRRQAGPPAASGSSLAPARGRPAAAGTTPAAGIPKLPALTLRAARGDPSRPPGCSAALRPQAAHRRRPVAGRSPLAAKGAAEHQETVTWRTSAASSAARTGRSTARSAPSASRPTPASFRSRTGPASRAGLPPVRAGQGRARGGLEEGQREPAHLLLGVARRSVLPGPGLRGADADRGRPRPVQPRLVPPAPAG